MSANYSSLVILKLDEQLKINKICLKQFKVICNILINTI